MRPSRFTPSNYPVDVLEKRMMLSVNWIGGNGDWNTGSNWSTGSVPGGNDDVTIGLAVTVTHSSRGAAANSITINNSSAVLALTGGTITVAGNLRETSGSFLLAGGTLLDATVPSGSTITATGSGGTLDTVTLGGILDETANSKVTILDGLTLNNGEVDLGNTAGTTTSRLFAGNTQSITGTGTIILGAAKNFIGTTDAFTLTFDSGITVRGSTGIIGAFQTLGSGSGSFINNGIIQDDVAGGSLTLNAASWANQGTLQALNGGTLAINGTTWANVNGANSGTINVDSTSTVMLGGSFNTSRLGNITRTGGTIDLSGTAQLQGGTLTLDGGPNGFGTWDLFGGSLVNGTVQLTNGAVLAATNQGGTLDTITLAGTLDETAHSKVTILNGLTLNNAEIDLGNAAGTTTSSLIAGNTQCITGTGAIVFGGAKSVIGTSGLFTLTFDTGITVRGSIGIIGAFQTSGSGSGSFINKGTIQDDVAAGSLTLNAASWANQGTLQAINGGTLTINGATWANLNGPYSGTIHVDNTSTVNLGGSFNTPQLGNVTRTGGTIDLSGTAQLEGGTLRLDGGPNGLGTWNLFGGSLVNGTVRTTNGAVLAATNQGGTLDSIALTGTLDETAHSGVTILNGLTLNNSEIDLGNAAGTTVSSLIAGNTESITGTGTIVFGGAHNVIGTSGADTLTFDTGITVRGATGTIGAFQTGGSGSGSFINKGIIQDDVAGGTLTLNAASWTNQGIWQAINGGSLALNGVSTTVVNSGIVADAYGTTISVGNNLVGSTTDAAQFNPLGTVNFNGAGTASSPQLLEAMSQDFGNVSAGFDNNFAFGALALSHSTYVRLVDNSHNSNGVGSEAVYATSLMVPTGSTLDLNGLHLYARAAQINGAVVGGTIGIAPGGGSLPLAIPTPSSILQAGNVDDWTFFGRAAQGIAVVLSTGTGGTFSAFSPSLNDAQIQVVDSNQNVLAQATNSAAGGDAILPFVQLPADGTYHFRVQADPAHPSSTGYYVIELLDATVHTSALNLGQNITGQLISPYSVENWTFSAPANEQVQFSLPATIALGMEFDLTGPNGWTGFSNLSTNSGLINLPTGGLYTVTAHSTRGAQGAYAFRIDETSQASLTLGTPFNGVFAGSGQAQLFTVDVAQSNQLLITLQDSGVNDATELYAKFGAPPTRADAQYAATSPSRSGQHVLIPTAAPGTWYILVYGANIAVPQTSYILTAVISPVALTTVFPDHFGNTADATVTLTGAGFDSTTTVSLVSSTGTAYMATSSQLDLPTQFSATFAAGSVPVGVYSVLVKRSDGASSTLPNAFTILQGGQAHLQTNLVAPGTLGYHIPGTFYLQYSNTGTVAMPAPIIEMTITQTHSDGTTDQKAYLTLDSSLLTQGFWTSAMPAGFSNTVQILASGATPGVLEPGESEQVPIYYAGWQQPWDFQYPSFNPEIAVGQASDTTPIAPTTLQAFQPPNVSAAAWNAMLPSLEAQIGNTWGGFVQRLDNDAVYLASLGEKVTDLNALWSFEVQQANGFSPLATLHSDTDASMPTVGPTLSVTRLLNNSIQGRSQLGPFGWGWNMGGPWQETLSVDPTDNKTVIITNTDGSQRLFQPDTRGGYFTEPGDTATLTAVRGGGYTLQKPNGSITAFNSDGTVAYLADTNGNRITAAYSSGNLASLTASSGQSLTFAWNAGRISSITDSAGRVTTYTYDSTNQYLLSVAPSDDDNDQYAYDTGNNPATAHALVSIYHFNNNATDHFVYNAAGQLISTDRNGNADQVTYVPGAEGDVSATDANGTIQYFFDAQGLLAKITDPLGNTTHYIYDNDSNLTAVIDPAGQTTKYSYDQHRNLTSTTNPDGATVAFTYSGPFNNLVASTDSNGNTTQYGYDTKGNLTAISYANGSQDVYSYDPLGNLQQSTNARGQTIGTTYNSMGELTREALADGSVLTYMYDAVGNLTSASDGTNTTAIHYNAAGDKLLEVDYPGGRSLKFTYDSGNRRTQSVDQTGFTVNYSYNAEGLLAGLTDVNKAPIVTYTYDATGRLTRDDKENGTYTTYDYDAGGHILRLINFAPGGAVNSRFDYTYDDLGRRLTMGTLDGVWTYTYDPAGQLTRAVFASNDTNVVSNQDLRYVYDAVGNRTQTIINGVTTTYVTDNMNQYTQIGSGTLTYDADGNLSSQTDAAGTTSYTYDSLNKLTNVASPVGSESFRYNPLGQLFASSQGGQTTQYVIDPIGLGNVVGAYAGSGSVIADYAYGLGLTSVIKSGGQPAYFDFDALGSTVGISGSSGSYQNSYTYLPFGGSLSSTVSIANAFQFGGEFGVVLLSRGLYLARARAFVEVDGRFVSRDPLGLSGGDDNVYRYVFNEPTSLIDPNGTEGGSIWPSCETVGCATGILVTSEGGPWGMFAGCLAGATLFNAACSPPGDSNPNGAAPPPFSTGEGPGSLPTHSPGPQNGNGGSTNGPFSANEPPPPGPKDGGAQDCGPSPKTGDNPAGNVCPPQMPNPPAHDPNAATGPVGVGSSGFISGTAALSYRIDFENDPTATAPAQQVFVTDQLDPNVKWTSVQLSEVGFGDNRIMIPSGSQYFQTTVPITENGFSFVVQIVMDLNPGTGLLTVLFQSIDPLTGLPPANSLTGLLPPEDGTGRGSGYFSYTAIPKPGLSTGTQIRNVASVTFDVNPPVTTDQVDDNDPSKGVSLAKQDLNTIDSVAPATKVTALPIQSPSQFNVNWSGQDDVGGSGIASYDVFVSDNGGSYTLFQGDVTTTSAQFAGQIGHTYSFFSKATDNVGNTESQHSTPDTTTTIVSPPSVTAPTTASLTENTSLTFSTGNGNAISVVDTAAVAKSDTVALSVTHGTLTLGSITGLTFTSGTNNAASMTIWGTLANLNAAVGNLTFTPTTGYSGSATLTISATNGRDNLTGSASVAITVNLPPPSVTAPATASVNEDASLTFSTGNGNAISLQDVAAVANSDTLALTVTHGKLALGSTTGLTFTTGTNNSAAMTIWGTLANINAALGGLTFTPTPGYAGAATMSITGENGRDNLTGSANVAVMVNVPPPSVTAPATASVNEDASLTFSTGNGNAISLLDLGAVAKSDTVTLTVTHGTLSLGSTTGLTFTSGGNNSAVMTIWGTLANLNAALGGLVFTPTTGYSGSAALGVTIKNWRNNLTGSASVAITVHIPPPSVTAPATASVNEYTSLTFSTGNGNSISVMDLGAVANSDTVTLAVTHGKLALGSTTGLTFVSGANGAASMTVWGTLANLNAALSGLKFTPTAGFSGAASLTITAKNGRDNLTGSASVAIMVNSA